MKRNTFTTDRNGTGTREWADRTYNICIGCEHDCLYCYAKAMRAWVDPAQRIPGYWQKQRLNLNGQKLGKEVGPEGVVMFPSSHDITPQFLPDAVTTIRNLLANNEVLIVTKPHLSVVKRLCQEFAEQRDRILFRFTIGSLNRELCAFWEPGAPPPRERVAALKHAHTHGFATSVSVEPMLDSVEATCVLVKTVEPFVTDTIWIGKMQRVPVKLNAKVEGFASRRETIREQQQDQKILRLVARLSDHTKVRWKDSIQAVLAKHQEQPTPQAAIRLYGQNRRILPRGQRSYWSDIKAWRTERQRLTGCEPVYVNVTSKSTDSDYRDLSPMYMGKVKCYREKGRLVTAINLEVAWQYSKVYSHTKDQNGNLTDVSDRFMTRDFEGNMKPSKEWFRWRDEAFTNPHFAHTDPEFEANKKFVRRAFPKGSKIACWYWNGELLDAVQARQKIYATLYQQFVVKTRGFQRLREILGRGDDLNLYDIDGYDWVALGMQPADCVADLNHPFGHGMVIAFLLHGIDPAKLVPNQSKQLL